MKALNLVLRFALELCMLAALAAWGFSLSSVFGQIALGIGTPVAAAALWGLFVAPKAARRLADPWRLAVELVLFGCAAGALAATGRSALAAAFLVVVLAQEVLMIVWGQRAAGFA